MEIEVSKFCLISIGAILFVLLMPLERIFPVREYTKEERGTSYLTNLLVFITNNIFITLTQITAVYAMAYNLRLHDGLTMLPLWGQVIATVVILDFFIWFWHMMAHKFDFLWALHKAHHSERYLNVTSSIRFHTLELVISIAFKSLLLIVFGIPFWIFLIYEVVVTFFAAFHHANIRLPKQVKYYLEKVIITPDMHRTHHSTLRSEHDSNYGVIFSWWDKMFGTYNPKQPKNIGLKGISEKRYVEFMSFPFMKK